VRCDSSKAELGDPCTEGAACSVDGKAMLKCEEGKVAHRANCFITPCKVEGDQVTCR
jgi:hypothetical protein